MTTDTEALRTCWRAIQGVEEPSVKDWLLFQLFTGIRSRDCLTLKWFLVDLERREINLMNGSVRYIGDFLLSVLQHYDQNDEYVFSKKIKRLCGCGNMIEEQDFDGQAYRRAVRRHGIEIKIHDLRKSYESVVLTSGLPKETVGALLDRRACFDSEHLRKAAQHIESRILELAV